MHGRKFAVAVVCCGKLESVACRRLSIGEASAFARSYNCVKDRRTAIVVPHPIRLATSHANARSRVS